MKKHIILILFFNALLVQSSNIICSHKNKLNSAKSRNYDNHLLTSMAPPVDRALLLESFCHHHWRGTHVTEAPRTPNRLAKALCRHAKSRIKDLKAAQANNGPLVRDLTDLYRNLPAIPETSPDRNTHHKESPKTQILMTVNSAAALVQLVPDQVRGDIEADAQRIRTRVRTDQKYTQPRNLTALFEMQNKVAAAAHAKKEDLDYQNNGIDSKHKAPKDNVFAAPKALLPAAAPALARAAIVAPAVVAAPAPKIAAAAAKIAAVEVEDDDALDHASYLGLKQAPTEVQKKKRKRYYEPKPISLAQIEQTRKRQCKKLKKINDDLAKNDVKLSDIETFLAND